MSDETTLTRRELEILSLLAEGLSNDEIAVRLVISPNTVKVHLRNIFEKMGVQSRTEATMEAVRRGWIAVPGRKLAETPVGPTPSQLPSWPPPTPAWQTWQSWLLIAVALLLLMLVLWPARPPVATSPAPASGFTTDLTTLRIGVAPRQETPRMDHAGAALDPAVGRLPPSLMAAFTSSVANPTWATSMTMRSTTPLAMSGNGCLRDRWPRGGRLQRPWTSSSM
ncbi:MAG: response regulator transcription factor [Anaerolineae bacterium]|nr:response regulator transcription factor [Anaerolineae bacterium]